MYKIFADETLIYDSTLEDYKIGKGSITLETNKSGSFSFSLYPDHFYYDRFVRLKTVITVYKSGKIIFRGRILNDVTDYWNNKVITCEGELGFLQDSIIRPFSFSGTPTALFTKFIEEHNSQVDEFKRFKIGNVTVVDSNNYIARENESYETALENLNSRLIEDATGGYFYITHGDDGTDPIPTIHYLADFTNVASQTIEFGYNLRNYTKTVKAEETATAIIPIGATISVTTTDGVTLEATCMIKSVNDGKDYVYDANAVALRGWIYKVVKWEDVTDPATLKAKAEEYLTSVINQNITIELTAIDLHLLDRSIESFKVCDYIRVISKPHNFDATLLCNKQTIDLLKPENDTVTLGYTYSTFTESSRKVAASVASVSSIKSTVSSVSSQVTKLNTTVTEVNTRVTQLEEAGGTTGENGATFTPSVSNEGVISWTNDKGLDNPSPVNIKGDKGDPGSPGDKGDPGSPGENGSDGISITNVTIDSEGNLIVTLSNGKIIDCGRVRGEKGDTGATGNPGEVGATGADGVGIVSIVQTTTSTEDDGNNVITITLSNGETSTFTVQNGSKGSSGETAESGSGIYVGETEPIDETVVVWINPNGDPDTIEPIPIATIKEICI